MRQKIKCQVKNSILAQQSKFYDKKIYFWLKISLFQQYPIPKVKKKWVNLFLVWPNVWWWNMDCYRMAGDVRTFVRIDQKYNINNSSFLVPNFEQLKYNLYVRTWPTLEIEFWIIMKLKMTTSTWAKLF